MVETSLTGISKGYYTSNDKIYSKNNKCCRVSNVLDFDAKKFSEWLKKEFDGSRYKTITELAEAAKSNKATISRLMSGASQTLTNKPSQPKRMLVKKLAELFEQDVNEVLMSAGYAPENIKPYPKELVMDYDGFDDDDLKEIAAFIQFRKQRKEAEKEKCD